MEATQRSAEVNARATTPQSLITEAQRLALDVEELVTKCVDEVPCLPDSDSQAFGVQYGVAVGALTRRDALPVCMQITGDEAAKAFRKDMVRRTQAILDDLDALEAELRAW